MKNLLFLTLFLFAGAELFARGGGGGGGGRSGGGGGGRSSSGSSSRGSSSGSSSRGSSSSGSKSSSGSSSKGSSSRSAPKSSSLKSSGGKTYSKAAPAKARANLTSSKMKAMRSTRTTRAQTQFSGVTVPPTRIIYQDRTNTIFWYWLLMRPSHTQTVWVYHHRDEIDDKRLEEMKQKNPNLDQELKDMEAQRIEKDSTYAPDGVDADLMYSDEYINDIDSEDQYTMDDASNSGSSDDGSGWVLFWIILGSIVFVGVIAVVASND